MVQLFSESSKAIPKAANTTATMIQTTVRAMPAAKKCRRYWPTRVPNGNCQNSLGPGVADPSSSLAQSGCRIAPDIGFCDTVCDTEAEPEGWIATMNRKKKPE